MFHHAISELGIEPAQSVMIGDQWSDAVAAQAAGVGRIALVGDPHAPRPVPPIRIERLADLHDAVNWLETVTDASPGGQA
jgi:FMN phosphatase YigB (HAD superfamily)